MVMIRFNWFPHNPYAEKWGINEVKFLLDTDGRVLYSAINKSTFIGMLKYPEITRRLTDRYLKIT